METAKVKKCFKSGERAAEVCVWVDVEIERDAWNPRPNDVEMSFGFNF